MPIQARCHDSAAHGVGWLAFAQTRGQFSASEILLSHSAGGIHETSDGRPHGAQYVGAPATSPASGVGSHRSGARHQPSPGARRQPAHRRPAYWRSASARARRPAATGLNRAPSERHQLAPGDRVSRIGERRRPAREPHRRAASTRAREPHRPQASRVFRTRSRWMTQGQNPALCTARQTRCRAAQYFRRLLYPCPLRAVSDALGPLPRYDAHLSALRGTSPSCTPQSAARCASRGCGIWLTWLYGLWSSSAVSRRRAIARRAATIDRSYGVRVGNMSASATPCRLPWLCIKLAHTHSIQGFLAAPELTHAVVARLTE